MKQPDVSLVIPVHNAMPYLITCLSSAMEQSIGRDRIEVVAVDDGSTDGSGEQLDVLAKFWDNLLVVHQENSDGPSRPRNVGMSRATGRYVFFLDADDYLGFEAMQRMVTLADDNSLDIVAGRRFGVGGPKQHRALPYKIRHSGIVPEYYDVAIQRSSNLQTRGSMQAACADCKNLYRKEFIDRLDVRFPEDINFGEDFHFAIRCVAAGKVGMVDDVDCYYDRLRDDGRNGSTLYGATEEHLGAVERGLRLGAEYGHPARLPSQQLRDSLLDLTQHVFDGRFPRRPRELRERMVRQAQAMLGTWLNVRELALVPALSRLKISLIQRGMEPELSEVIRAAAAGECGQDVIADGRVFAAYPYFRDPVAGLPDDCYDVTDELQVVHHLAAVSWEGTRLRLTGHAYIEHVETADVTTTLLFRDRLGRSEQRCPVRPLESPDLSGTCGQARYYYPLAGLEAELDVALRPLPPGQWSAFLAVGAQGVVKEVPVGGNRAGTVAATSRLVMPPGSPGLSSVIAHFTRYGTLTLDVAP